MRPRLSLPLLAAALLLAAPAAAAVPSSANSSLPACMALCPMGDMPFNVVVRDLANNPIPGSTVVLDFSQCPKAYLCAPPVGGSFPYTLDLTARTLRVVSDAGGGAAFPAHVGGTGPAGSVRVYADGVQLRSYALASPDQDGNGVCVSVIGTDDPTFAAKLGTTDPTADFDCNGVVNAADQTIFFAHHSHGCLGFVEDARRSTWGAVKVHYR